MSQPSSKHGCFVQSISRCLGFFKRNGSNTQTKQCNSNTKFSQLNNRSPSKQSQVSDDVCCYSCCSLKKKSIDYQEKDIAIGKQPQQVMKPEQIPPINDKCQTKLDSKADVQNIVGVTNTDRINIDYSTYLTNSKDEGLVKSNSTESINTQSAKNNNQMTDVIKPVNTNNSCYSVPTQPTKSLVNKTIAQNNNKHCNTDEPNEKSKTQETMCVQHEILTTVASNEVQTQREKMVPSASVCRKPESAVGKKIDSNLSQVNGISITSDAVEHDTVFFRDLTSNESIKLANLCKVWEETEQSDTTVPEEVQNEIRSVIGQTRLVISERFAQFLSLVDRADGVITAGDQENLKPITNTDLQGFWDMIYFQVEDVQSKFMRLSVAKSKGWTFEQNNTKPKRIAHKKSAANSKMKPTKPVSEAEKARKEAARKRILEARRNMALRNKEVNKTVDQGDAVLIL